VAASITDYGLCSTINGNPMDATYKGSEKMDVFKKYLDRRPKDNYIPLNVSGSGTSHTTRKETVCLNSQIFGKKRFISITL
jgi:hypothetical protein